MKKKKSSSNRTNQDPLAKLEMSRTKRLDSFFSLKAEEEGSLYNQQFNPELQAVEQFLSHA